MMNFPIKGAWAASEVEAFLDRGGLPLRLACTGGDGFPRVVSLWYRYQQGQLVCVTHKDAHILALLNRDNRVGFEVAPNEPPYHGVRGQGTAEITDLGAGQALEELLGRYLGGTESSLAQWLMSRSDEERVITISPTRVFSWDYRLRMADAVGA